MPHRVDSAALPYLVGTPPADPSAGGERRPVLCFLHGYDEAAPLEIHRGLRRHGPLSDVRPALADRAFVVVAPQLPRAGDLWHRYADAVEEIVRQVQVLHGGDPERCYLTGFSFGGNGVFDLAIAQPGFWAAVWSVDPTRVPAGDPGLPVWLSIGEIARRRTTGFIDRLGLRPLGATGKASAGDRVFVDQGGDHVGAAASAYADERIYRWLLARRRARGRG